MTRALERAGFALALLLAGVGANSVAMGLTRMANAQVRTALSSLRDGAVPSPPVGFQSHFAGDQ